MLNGGESSFVVSALDLLNSYSVLFIAAFLVTLLCTPIVRRIATSFGVVDRPDAARKLHQYPVAYLGGVAVFLGVLAAIVLSLFLTDRYTEDYRMMPIAIVIGMVAITFTGLGDDVWGWDPRLKIAGQLVAAAALAVMDVGVRVAEGLLTPFLGSPNEILLTIAGFDIVNGHLYYWVGTAIIAVFVLGGCNSANLLDGLDGLLSGIVAIAAIGLLAISLLMLHYDNLPATWAAGAAAEVQEAVDEYHETHSAYPHSLEMLMREDSISKLPDLPSGWPLLEYDAARGVVSTPTSVALVAHGTANRVQQAVRRFQDREGAYPTSFESLLRSGYLTEVPVFPNGWKIEYRPNTGTVVLNGPLTGARIILCLALLGAVLGFLPHNFNPANIFLGDCGSHLLGYLCVVIILLLGDQGHTHLVFAGLIVFSVPIMDTTLAMIRRVLSGTALSAADDQHIHHQFKRGLGGVKRAVFALYGVGAAFAILGVSLALLVMQYGFRVRMIYAIALVLFSFIGVIAVKAARAEQRKRANSTRTEEPIASRP